MSYDIKKYSYEWWNTVDYLIKQNKNKIIFKRKKFIKDNYYKMMNKSIDLKNPKTFTEKLNVNKLNRKKMKYYSKYADKHLVRKFVSNRIGNKYLIKQYFCKKKITVDDFEQLPNSFVLKTNNGSGGNYLVLDKTKEDKQKLCDYMNRIVKVKYGFICGEMLYNYIKPRIIAEKLLLDKKGNIPDDLKCFCFIDNNNKKRKILYVERVIGDDRKRIMFDENWNAIKYGSSFGVLNEKIPKPKNLNKILKIIDKLSQDFNFVRVDLFLLNEKIYFGELTFIPTAGYLKFDDDKVDTIWGSYIGNNLN